jgi:phage shock protein A
LTARKKAAEVKARVSQIGQASDLDQKAFEKFERMRKKVEMAEAEAEAMSELSRDSLSKSLGDIDLEKKAKDLDIEAELAALKKKKAT